MTLSPVVFWHSQPVNPGDALMLAGGDFAHDAKVEFQAVPSPDREWLSATPLQQSDGCIKVVVPDAICSGLIRCRVTQGGMSSSVFYLNEPNVWWMQGDSGLLRARQGGWLRLLGICLAVDDISEVNLQRVCSDNSAERSESEGFLLKARDVGVYSITVDLPVDISVGQYEVWVHNGAGAEDGWRSAGTLQVLPKKNSSETILNVCDMGADPTGIRDSTSAIVAATERISGLGGGVVIFPRGRYRIDSGLRSGTWIPSGLLIPENVTFRGEDRDLVTLWWPDRPQPLPTLVDGRNGFGLEELSIYTQGTHSTIVTAASHARIRRVRIRANCYYMTGPGGKPHHLRGVNSVPAATGAAFLLWGEDNQVTDCDIYCSATAFDIRVGKGSLIAHNVIHGNNMQFINGACETIFEHNEFTGNSLTAGGNNIALHFGSSTVRHIYYAYNHVRHIYGGDHEALTLDGHGVAYFGRVGAVEDDRLTLTADVFFTKGVTGGMCDTHSCAVYIVEGRGTGQYRWLLQREGRSCRIDRAWDIPPDESSILLIGTFNGRHLIIGNTAEDAGPSVQLYPPNCECIVADNISIRASNLNCLGKVAWQKQKNFPRVEPSWYNQFLGNEVRVGNGWGGGRTQIDRWLGGEGCLNIWGWQVSFRNLPSGDVDEFLTAEDLRQLLQEEDARIHSFPITRWIVVRQHKVENNSSIRIHGCVADVVVEQCDLCRSARGIRIEEELFYQQPEELGQLFDFDPEPGAGAVSLPFLKPEQILLRENRFTDVELPFSGTAINQAQIL